MKPENKKVGIYTTMTQPINRGTIKMPTNMFNEIYEDGYYVTTSNGKYPQVHYYDPSTGKPVYACTLANWIKGTSESYRPKDGDWRNQTLSNLKNI